MKWYVCCDALLSDFHDIFADSSRDTLLSDGRFFGFDNVESRSTKYGMHDSALVSSRVCALSRPIITETMQFHLPKIHRALSFFAIAPMSHRDNLRLK